jgi:hypothetical protein
MKGWVSHEIVLGLIRLITAKAATRRLQLATHHFPLPHSDIDASRVASRQTPHIADAPAQKNARDPNQEE